MDKLYSRGKRFRLPHRTNLIADKKEDKKKKKINKNKKKVITLITILVIAFFIMYQSMQIIAPVFDEVATDKAKATTVTISNDIAKQVMEQYEYSDLITIHKDEKDNIKMIETNIVNINKIRAEIASKMQEQIEQLKDKELSLAMGSFTGIKVFIGKGPSIPIKITPIGNIETEYISQFKAAGINQTYHQICLNIKCTVGIMSPFKTVNKTLESQVVLAENIIVGDVPESYYNFEGLEGSESLNMLQ